METIDSFFLDSLRKFQYNISDRRFEEEIYSVSGLWGVEKYKKLLFLLGIESVFCKIDDFSLLEGKFLVFGLEGNFSIFEYVNFGKKEVVIKNDSINRIASPEQFYESCRKYYPVFLFIEEKETVFFSNYIKSAFDKFIFAIPLIILGIAMFIAISLPVLMLPILCGIFVSSLLLLDSEKMDVGESMILCKKDETMDCSKVLSSKYARLFGFKLSVLAISFFFSLFSILIFIRDFELLYVVIWIGAIMATYSIIIQHFVLKEYCKYCLIVDFLIFSQLIFFGLGDFTVKIEAGFLLIFLCVFSLFVLLFSLYGNIINRNYSYQKKYFESIAFKRNFKYIVSVINNSNRLTAFNGQNRIYVNKTELDDSLNLVLISNPFCKKCSQNFIKILEELRFYGSFVNVEIRFLINNSVAESDKVMLVNYFQSIYIDLGLHAFIEAYLDWIGNRDFDRFKHKWDNKINFRYFEVFEEIEFWGDRNRIYLTPSFLLNERKIPGFLEVEDFKYFFSEFHSSQESPNLTELPVN